MATCQVCGQQNPDEFRFCGNCGSPLEPRLSAQREARRTITVLFCDLADSTALGERLDPESLQRVLGRYFQCVREVLERHHGTVQELIGDAVVGVFGIPRLREDDALRAARATAELQVALAGLNEELERDWGVALRVRGGLNTGEVVPGSPEAGGALVLGDAANMAARLQQAAAPGEVLLGQTTWELVGDAVLAEPVEPLAVKGKSDRLPAWRLLAVAPTAPGVARRRDVLMVGRQAERRVLLDAFERVEAERACGLVTVLGAAGVGKSRLVESVLAELGGRAERFGGRCPPYGEGITYWPVAEVVRQAAGIGRDDPLHAALGKLGGLLAGQEQGDRIAGRVAAAVGLAEATEGTEETFWAVRKLLEHLADRRPLVLAFDDLHWAEPTLLDLLEYLGNFARGAPLLLLCVARTELLDGRPDWGRTLPAATTLPLEPLSGAESDLLVTRLLGAEAPAAARITARAGGNPLFVEELVAKLVDDGLLRRDGDHWTASPQLDQADIPATVQVLLTARLERLPGEERAVLGRASLVGESFSWAAVAALTPAPRRARLGGQLAALVRRDLLRPDTSEGGAEDALRFRHGLVRDAAYQALPKRDRAELHERLAGWLRQRLGERLGERRELLGYHLEQSYRSLVELGPADEHARELAGAAAEELGTAGRQALARGDAPAAANLLGRALALLEPEDPARLRLLPGLGAALTDLDQFERADAVLGEAVAAAEAGDAERLALRASLDRWWLRLRTKPARGRAEAVAREVERAITRLTELDDALGLAKAWLLRSEIDHERCRFAAMGEAAEQAMDHARRAGATRARHQGLAGLLVALRSGPTPAAEALRRCEQLRGQAGGDRFAELSVDTAVGALQILQGRSAEARELLARVGRAVEELGLAGAWPFTTIHRQLADLERLAGNLGEAERRMRALHERQRQAGDHAFLASTAVELADMLARQGRDDEALRLTEGNRATASPDDLAAQAGWRRVHARVVARRGSVEEAERLAREAVELVAGTDWLQGHGDALLDLAEVLALAGQAQSAAAAARQAAELYQRKGDVVMTARARSRLAELAQA